MTPALDVIVPGLQTSVQDQGRIGFQDVGLPASGPLDRISLRLANALVGNSPGMPALEILLQGPAFRVMADSVRIALVGGDGNIEIDSDRARVVAAGRSVRLVRGEVFRVRAPGATVCAYLAIEGGPGITPLLGSASTYVRSGIGGFRGRTLRQGDALPLALGSVAVRDEYALSRSLDLDLEKPVRVILGPQREYFTDDAVATLLSSDYVVSNQADRMGYRLDGPALAHAKGYDIVSDGTVVGAIQVPGSGQPIILMVDNQTTGGYPKIATVISADIPVVGRRKPGRAIRFVAVDIEDALRVRREQEAAVQRHVDTIRRVATTGEIDVAALYTENLVSGVTSAFD
jgi:allophanate hydrolase